MNTRSRITLSTVLGLTLVGVGLGAAQAQSGNTKMHSEKTHERTMDSDTKREGEMEEDDYETPEPAPINYPFAAPGGLHLYHYTDYTEEGLEPDSAYSKKVDNEFHKDRILHDRMKHDSAMTRADRMRYGGYYMTDESGMTMNEEDMADPAPLGYPFSAPAGLHLYHFTDYSMEGVAEGSATMKKMDNMEKEDETRRDRMKYYGGREVDENDMTMYEEMAEPAPLGYPFSAPGGLHLYHFTDYSMEGVAEGSATMKKMDDAEKMEKKMKRNKTSK